MIVSAQRVIQGYIINRINNYWNDNECVILFIKWLLTIIIKTLSNWKYQD